MLSEDGLKNRLEELTLDHTNLDNMTEVEKAEHIESLSLLIGAQEFLIKRTKRLQNACFKLLKEAGVKND